MNGLIGKKIGMTSIFDEAGRSIACTVVEATPNVVTQVKTVDTDGYDAVQLGYDPAKVKNTSNQMMGHFKKAGVDPVKKLVEFKDCSVEMNIGDAISMTDIFNEGDIVSAIGTSKGKGFQGVVKRHNFRGVGDATHGQHNRLRAPGSIGAASYPAKVFKGMRMGGRMGGDRVKIKGLSVIKMMPEQNVILIKGAIPGHKGSLVIIEKR